MERQLTREKLLHTHSACLPEHGSVRLLFRETRALSKREEKTIDLGAQIFFVPTHLPLPPPRPPAPRRGSESELSFTANPNTRGFGRGSSTNQARDLKMSL